MLKIYRDVIARKRSDGKTQNLEEHIKSMVKISDSISHYSNISKLIVYLHDLGKISKAFENYLNGFGERGSVIHAWQGAFLANELFSNSSLSEKLLKEIISLCVTAHHNHLDDGVAPDGATPYYDKFLNTFDPKYFFEEIKDKLTESEKVELQELFINSKLEINGLLDKINGIYKDRKSANFAIGLFVKYLFSCLVDADRLDAYLFEMNERYVIPTTNWDSLINKFEENISKFPNKKEIDIIRKSVSDKCKSAAYRESGIYQLSVPTGGGKTLSSLRYALHHSKIHNKKRIIYVIPYLSIIEQTGNNLRDILNLPKDNNVVFEHHSNIMEPEDEISSEIRKLSSARWDSPIIITTMVQFLESVMSSKSGKLRKFASMADSVIIFDEIQSMPIKSIHCFNEVVTFLSKILNSTMVLCSATQPTLEATQRENLLLNDNPKLIDCLEEFKNLKRVNISVETEKDYEEASEFIFEKANFNGDCLVIVNTKNSALEMYNRLKRKLTDFEILHLSTSMCPIHRGQLIDKMKKFLNNNQKVICISTQLIEAGVDISFSCVVRAMAGLDSIAQAAGRCNRNGESTSPKIVYTFPLKDENLEKLIDIKSGKEITAQIIQNREDGSDLLDEEIMTMYYRRYFAKKDSQMDYMTKDGETLYAMLSENDYGKNNYKNKTGDKFPHFISHAFHSADRNFDVIDKNGKSVVVMFDKAESLMEKYKEQPNGIVTKEKVKILKELQKYSVSLYKWQLLKLAEQHAIYALNDETGILCLAANYYSQETGVVLKAIQENLIT